MKYLSLIIFFVVSSAWGADVKLAWNANTDPIAGYNFRVGIESGIPLQIIDVGNVTTYTVAGLNYGTTYYFTVTAYNADGESSPSNEVVYTALPPIPDKIRYHPCIGLGSRMVGGVFEGANAINGPYTTLHTIASAPSRWAEVEAPLGAFRFLRYRGNPNIASYCNVAEIEFYRNGVKLTGAGYGTPGSYKNNGNTFQKALDGDINTRFDAPTASGGFVGIDTGGTP